MLSILFNRNIRNFALFLVCTLFNFGEISIAHATNTEMHFGPGINCKQRAISLIEKSVKSIEVFVGCFNDRDVYDALINAIASGVNVSIISGIDDIKRKNCSSSILLDLLSNGAVLFGIKQKSQKFPYRFTIIDDNEVIFGNYDWTYANAKEFHACIISSDSSLLDPHNEKFEYLKELSKDNMITFKSLNPDKKDNIFHKMFPFAQEKNRANKNKLSK